jgi:hypothetical protein
MEDFLHLPLLARFSRNDALSHRAADVPQQTARAILADG